MKLSLVMEHVDRAEVLSRHKGICHICATSVDPEDWHLDHVIPLTRKGPHCYANTAPAHPACNLSKGANWAGSPNPDIDALARASFLAFHGRPFAD